MSDRMHRCPADDCLGHDTLAGVVTHGFQLIIRGQVAILQELRHHRGIPDHVQAGMNALDKQIRAARRALTHQIGTHSPHQGENP